MTRILVILAILGIVAWRRRPVSSQTDPADRDGDAGFMEAGW